MNTEELRAFLSKRTEGPWELMATAMGVQETVERTRRGLSTSEIQMTAAGTAISPAVIDCRTQALAAFDPGLVEEIVTTWPSPGGLHGRSVHDLGADFWIAAWCSCLRFVPRVQLQVAAVEKLPEPLRTECHTLTSLRSQRGVSDSVADATVGTVSYDDLRQIARHVIPDEEVQPVHVDRLVGNDGQYLERLRILTEAKVSFSEAARNRVLEIFRSTCLSGAQTGETGGTLILSELVCRHAHSDSAISEGAEEVVKRLKRDGPRAWQCTAYLFARTNWTCR